MSKPKPIDHISLGTTIRRSITWEDGALTLERLEDELLGNADDHATTTTTTMPPPSSTLFLDAPSLPRGSTSQPPPALARGGGHAGPSLGCGSSRSTSVATGDDNPTPFVHRPQEKKVEISRGKRKHP